jgi:hypothetical protein
MQMLSRLLALACCAAASYAPTGPEYYTVKFDTPNPLGLQLDASLRVASFSRDAAGGKMPAERTGWVRVGDSLVSVNGERVAGVSLSTATTIIARAALPRVLGFAGPPGSNRGAEMRGVFDGPAGIHGHEGALELASRAGGVALGAAPFLQAMFGGPMSCAAAPLVLAEPPHGCGAYANTRGALGAIVVVERGLCTFSDKAAIAQGIGAVGLVVLNDAGNAFVRMPIDEREAARLDITLPVVMVDAGRGAETLRALLSGSALPRAGAGGAGAATAAPARPTAAAPPGATATPAPTRVLGGVQGRLVQAGLSCKPWKAPAAARGGRGLKGGAGGGRREGLLGGGEGGVGDPAAPAGELLLFPPGAALRRGGEAAAAAHSAARLRSGGGGAHAGHADGLLRGGGGGGGAAGEEEAHPETHSEGFYSDAGGAGSDGLVHGGGGGEGGGGPARASSAGDAAAAAVAAAAARAAEWAREEAGGGGELATAEDLAAAAATAAALSRARAGSSARADYLRAAFGAPLPQGRLRIALAEPFDACGAALRSGGGGPLAGAAVLVGRGGCGFADKARAVARAGAALLLVANNEPGLTAMRGDAGEVAAAGAEGGGGGGSPLPPAAMVTRGAGALMREAVADAERRGALVAAAAAAAGGSGSGAAVHAHAAAGAHPEAAPGPTVAFIGNADAAAPWEELAALAEPSAWAEDAAARKKAYARHARVHHPDRPTGSQERFQLLAFLYRRANHHYDPASEPDFRNEL